MADGIRRRALLAVLLATAIGLLAMKARAEATPSPPAADTDPSPPAADAHPSPRLTAPTG